MTLLSFLFAVGLLSAAVHGSTNSAETTTLKCDTSTQQYYSIQSFVQPFYGSGSDSPASNSTKVESNLSLGCVQDELVIDGKRFQEWRLNLCSMHVHQPCPNRDWGRCSEDYQCMDTWNEGSNTAFFYVETAPNPGNVYWDPSDEGNSTESYTDCFSKYAVLQQIQGALTKKFSPEKIIKQDNKFVDGVLVSSVRFEASEKVDDVKIPGNTMNAHIQMQSANADICAPRTSTLDRCSDKKASIVTSRFPHASLAHILSTEAVCPNTKSYVLSVSREFASCDKNVELLIHKYFMQPNQMIYNEILKCFDAEDRPEFMNKYASQLESAFRQHSMSEELMRDSISLMIILPSKDIVKRAVNLIESISATESHDVVLSLAQMLSYSPIVESVGIPAELVNIVTKYTSTDNQVVKYNALLILASIARRTGIRSGELSAEKVQSLPLLVRLDILRNAGNAYTQSEFWKIFMSGDIMNIKNGKLIEDAISNRSDRNQIKLAISTKYNDIPDFHWNVSIPEFSMIVGSKDLLGADYLHKAYAGLDYESCNTHEVRKFQYAVNANTHLTLYYLDKTYQLWEVIVEESGSSDSTSRTDYVRLVWRNDVYYNGPIINLDCKSIHLDLFNKRFDFPAASAVFQIGPIPVRLSLLDSAIVDVQFDGEVCPLQGTVKGLLDPSIYNSLTGSACAGIFAVKACAEVTGAFKTHLKPGFEASLMTCPHVSVCPQADLTFTNNELKIEGSLKIKSFRGTKEFKKTFGDWKFKDVVKPLIEKGKCIKF